MTSKQFINALAKNSGLTTSETTTLMSKFAEIIVDGIKDNDSMVLQGFGNFELKAKAERKMYNPSTKGYRIIPESKSMAFHPSTLIKDKLNPSK